MQIAILINTVLSKQDRAIDKAFNENPNLEYDLDFHQDIPLITYSFSDYSWSNFKKKSINESALRIVDVTYAQVISMLKRFDGIEISPKKLFPKETAGSIINYNGVTIATISVDVDRSTWASIHFACKRASVDTTIADDKVIKQMLTLCEKGNRVFLNAADEALELENAIENGEAFDDDGDELYDICLPANKYIKQLYTLSRKIKNPELKEAVLNCLDDVTNGAQWDEVLQYWADETGWDAVGGIDEWAEVTFGAYLKTHDIHIFDSVREY